MFQLDYSIHQIQYTHNQIVLLESNLLFPASLSSNVLYVPAHTGQTNAKAERLNGKIQRFISNNYGIKDKDFALYRIKKYFE